MRSTAAMSRKDAKIQGHVRNCTVDAYHYQGPSASCIPGQIKAGPLVCDMETFLLVGINMAETLG